MTVRSTSHTIASNTPVDQVTLATITADGGTWRMRIVETWSNPLAYDITPEDATDEADRLGAIDGWDQGDVTITDGPGDNTGSTPYTFTYTGTLAGRPVPLPELDDSGLLLTVEDEEVGGTAEATEDTPGSARTYPLTTGDSDTIDGTHITVTNAGSEWLYLGGPDVTYETGFPLASGSTLPWVLELTGADKLYACTQDGDTTDARTLETGT